MKVMVLLSRLPHPLDKGDKLRAYHQLKRLAQYHDIYLCCLSDKKPEAASVEHLKSFCRDICIIRIGRLQIAANLFRGIFSKKPFQVHYFHSGRLQAKVDKYIEKHMPAHIYCQLIRVTEFVIKYTIIPKTLDYMDAFSKGMHRRSEKVSWPLRMIFREEARRLCDYERQMFALFRNKTIISEQDKECIDHPLRNKIKVIPNGVDTAFFYPIDREKKYELVFTGNMNYPPNVESARFLVRKILPLLKGRIPTVRLIISGTSPSMEVRALASANVSVTGWVDDIRESYASARIFIAAMQTGTGLQNKLLEAMAMHLPCITSVLANNAIGATDGEHILVGSSPGDYAEHILSLLSDPHLYETIAANGYQFVTTRFDWNATVRDLNEIFTV